jgi:hypothetical protein
MKNEMDLADFENLVKELVEQQKKTMLNAAKKIVPQVIQDDLMQPNDFIELENNPLFRYEEGVLAGIQTLQMAVRAIQNNSNN